MPTLPAENYPQETSYTRELIETIALEGRNSGMKPHILPTRELSLDQYSVLNEELSPEEKKLLRFPSEEEVLYMIDKGELTAEQKIEILDIDPVEIEQIVREHCTNLEEICEWRMLNSKRRVEDSVRSKSSEGSIGQAVLAGKLRAYVRRSALEMDDLLDWLTPLATEYLSEEEFETFAWEQYSILLRYMAVAQVASDTLEHYFGSTGLVTHIKDKTRINDYITGHVLDLRAERQKTGELLNPAGLSLEESRFWESVKKLLPESPLLLEALESRKIGITTEAKSFELIWHIARRYNKRAELSDSSEDLAGKDIILRSEDGSVFCVVDIQHTDKFPYPVIFTVHREGLGLVEVVNSVKKEYNNSTAVTYDISSQLIRDLKRGGPPAIILRVPGDMVSGKPGSQETVEAVKAGMDSEIGYIYQYKKKTEGKGREDE